MSAHVSKNGFSQLRDGTTQGRRYRGDARISRVLGSVVDLDLYACFQTLLPHMQLIWELVLLGQVSLDNLVYYHPIQKPLIVSNK